METDSVSIILCGLAPPSVGSSHWVPFNWLEWLSNQALGSDFMLNDPVVHDEVSAISM